MTCELERRLHNDEAYLLNIVGPSGCGKTNKLFFILEKWLTEDRLFFRHYDPKLVREFPQGIRRRASTFKEFRELLGRPGLVILDDLPAQAYGGDFGRTDSKDFVRQLTFERHNDHRFIATSQNDQLVLKGLLESLNVINLISEMSPSATVTCRNPELQEQVNFIISGAREAFPEKDLRSFCYCPETRELFTFPYMELPEAIGKPYRGCVVEDGQLIRV